MQDPGSRSLRVLMLSWEYPPAVASGLGRHVRGLSVALAAAGHDVTVLTRETPGAPREERLDGVRVLRLPAGHPLPRPAAGGAATLTPAVDHALTGAALIAVAGHRYDIVHAHDWLVAHTADMLTAALGGDLVITLRATGTGWRKGGRLPPRLEAAVGAARRVIVTSPYARNQVTDLLGLRPDRVAVVSEGVDPQAWQVPARDTAAARLRFAGAGQLIGYAGRLAAEKGVSDLLAALPRLRRNYPGLRAVIAGDGPIRSQLHRQARMLKLGRAVSFTGFLDHPELAAMITATDAMVVPSRVPASMVALEAAAAGTPLAIAGVAGVTDLVEPGVTAVTFPPGDPDGLAEAVDRLLSDPAFARRLADRARDGVTTHTWEMTAARTAEVYAGIVSSPAGGHAPARRRPAPAW